MSGFVKPVSIWVALAGLPVGDSIEIKKELNVGDQKRLQASGMRRVQRQQPNGEYQTEMEIDWEIFEIARTSVWVTDWSGPSFLNEDGTKVAYSMQAIKALNAETFDRLQAALFEHVAAIEQEKKLKATANG